MFVLPLLPDLLFDGNNAHLLPAWDLGVGLLPNSLRAITLGELQCFGLDGSSHCQSPILLCLNVIGH